MHALWAESISSMPELLEEVRPLNQGSLQMFEEQIRIAIQRGEIDPGVDVESLAVMIFGMLRGVVAQWLIESRACRPRACRRRGDRRAPQGPRAEPSSSAPT